MVKHMIVWKFKEEITDKAAQAEKIKVALEDLVGRIDGLIEMKIITEKLSSSSGDLMMDSTFSDYAALEAYQAHPLHKEVANGLVRPSMSARLSLDYEV
ncbi:MAG: Dabb family protein [Ruminococcaceae bacterium]|nr:Dabb family protein [Oscillospiraceae bacterium]